MKFSPRAISTVLGKLYFQRWQLANDDTSKQLAIDDESPKQKHAVPPLAIPSRKSQVRKGPFCTSSGIAKKCTWNETWMDLQWRKQKRSKLHLRLKHWVEVKDVDVGWMKLLFGNALVVYFYVYLCTCTSMIPSSIVVAGGLSDGWNDWCPLFEAARGQIHARASVRKPFHSNSDPRHQRETPTLLP